MTDADHYAFIVWICLLTTPYAVLLDSPHSAVYLQNSIQKMDSISLGLSSPAYTRSELFRLRRLSSYKRENLQLYADIGILRYRGARGGVHAWNFKACRNAICACFDNIQDLTTDKIKNDQLNIQFVRGHLHSCPKRKNKEKNRNTPNPDNLIRIRSGNYTMQKNDKLIDDEILLVPTLYVFNSCSLAKPYALQQLQAELSSYEVDAAIISETHFKTKHTNEIIQIDGYNVIRRDRQKRKAGGVAIILHEKWQFNVLNFLNDDCNFEILWVSAVKGNNK